ncbi:MAG: hypothetical protein GEV12_09000 [Micromonosporaceae bacterium]|nr:hypothetical protein [Micromonosporaceae bacterium]
MNRANLTARYLEEVKRSGVRASDLVTTDRQSEELQIQYQDRYLSRPLFLGHEERERLHADVANLRSALVSLPDRLFGGDLAGFARALGMADVQVSAILRSRGTTVTQQSRADLYTDETGFKLLEFNMGSAIGGIDNSDMCRMLLEHPVLAEFARTHRLDFVDTMREQVNNMLVESGFAPGSKPVMATTDWPSSFQTLEPFMRHFTGRLQEMGIDAHPCHIGQLEVRDGRVWLGERPVDIIQRLFMLEDLLEYPDAAALMDPILDAAARGEVKIFTPMDAELFASKAALAMLSDEQHRERFDPEELASIDRILPWTRMVRPGLVTLEDGRRVELLDYALQHQQDLALKPTLLHGGEGVLLGWRPDTDPDTWQERVRSAMDEPYVIQRRIRPVPELFPTDDGDPIPWIVSWGVFTVVNGYGGVYVRAITVDSGVEVINHSGGAYSGGCLHALP